MLSRATFARSVLPLGAEMVKVTVEPSYSDSIFKSLAPSAAFALFAMASSLAVVSAAATSPWLSDSSMPATMRCPHESIAYVSVSDVAWRFAMVACAFAVVAHSMASTAKSNAAISVTSVMGPTRRPSVFFVIARPLPYSVALRANKPRPYRRLRQCERYT